MRIGTWNMAGKWSEAHARLFCDAACDLWLLTEVPDDLDLPGSLVRSGPMRAGKSYAAVWSSDPLGAAPVAHEASATAIWRGLVVCSSVLPWRACASVWPDPGATIGERTARTVHRISGVLTESVGPVIWGGDWNNSLEGPNPAGTAMGRAAILTAIDQLGLQVPTTSSEHLRAGLRSIDHVAVPRSWTAAPAERIDAGGLSDHAAYVLEAPFS